jgi:hypothetical protein
MKTAMQELLEWVRATLPMDLETPQMIEQKIKSMLDKEKEQMIDFARNIIIDATCSVEGYVTTEKDIEDYYSENFNEK